MSVIPMQVMVSQHASDLGQVFQDLIDVSIKQLSDGYQPSDLLVIGSAIITDATRIVGDIVSLPAEEKENADAFELALELKVRQMVKSILSAVKAAAPVAPVVA